MQIPSSLIRQQLVNLGLALVTRQSESGRSPGLPMDKQTSDQGVTLLECLVAIIVIGLTVAMVTPPLFLATATRVQNRRAEQAFQLAQGEIDRVRVLVEKGQHVPARIPATVAVPGGQLEAVPPPTAVFGRTKSINPTCNQYDGSLVAAASALPVDIDGDCAADFLVQTFRTAGSISPGETASGSNRPTDFRMGVRVYSIVAEENLRSGALENPVRPASLQFTTGQGNQRTRPLAVIYSNYSWSDRGFALCDYQTDAGRTCR